MSELAVRAPDAAPARIGGLTRTDVEFVADLARTVVGTDFVKKGIRNNIPAIIACGLYGRALGLDLMVALREIDVIDGNASMSATLVAAKVRKAGHKLWAEETRDDRGDIVAITACGERTDGTTDRFTWTLKMAQRAGLSGKNVWQKYPEAMLWSRACTALARRHFSDVFMGSVYTAEELGVDDVSAGEPEAFRRVSETAPTGESPSPVEDSVGEDDPTVTGGTPGRNRLPQASPAEPLPGEGEVGNPPPSPGEPPAVKEHARPWVLSPADLAVVVGEVGGDERAGLIRANWDDYPDAVTIRNKIREQTDVNLLLFLADHEAHRLHKDGTSGARKGVLEDLHRQLVSLGWRSPEPSGPAPARTGSASSEPLVAAQDAASGASPLPEALQAANPLVRIRALSRAAEGGWAWPHSAEIWSEEAILNGIREANGSFYVTIFDVPDEELTFVWSQVPADVREHLEALSLEELEDLANGDTA